MQKTFGVLLLSGVAALLAAGCRAKPSEAPARSDPGVLRLGLVYSGNVLGTIDPCGCVKNQLGGLARRATLIRKVGEKVPHVLYVDYGNLLFPLGGVREIEREQLIAKARLLVEAQAKLGMDAYTPGGGDLSAGLAAFREIFAGTGVPVVSANLADPETGALLFAPSVVIDVGGTAFGITGVSEPSTEKAAAEGVQVLEPLASLEPVLADLRRKAQRIVILSRMQLEGRQKLAHLAGVDFVIGSQRAINTAAAWSEGGALLADVLDRGQQAGVLVIELAPGRAGFVNSSEVERLRNELSRMPQAGEMSPAPEAEREPLSSRSTDLRSRIQEAEARNPYTLHTNDVNQGVPEDHDFFLLVDQFRQRQEASAKKLYGDSWDRFIKGKNRYGGNQSCKACHLPQYDFWQKTDHSRAFASLEKTHQSADMACIKCHTTAKNVDWLPKGGWVPPFYRNVQCEACHGPAAGHTSEPLKILPTWPPGKNICLQCHGVQHGEKFNFEKKIREAACPVTSGKPSRIPELIRTADEVAPRTLQREDESEPPPGRP